MELLSSHHYEGVRSSVGPEVDFLHCHPSFIFCWTMFPLGLFLALGGGGCGAAPADVLRKTGALETLEVWGMEKEWDFGEMVAP